MSFVLDASVALAWVIDGERNAYTEAALDRLRDGGAVAPTIWLLEVANGLLMGERRGRVTSAQVLGAVAMLAPLPIRIASMDSAIAWGPVLASGRANGLTAYDATYLELAAREGLPLATQDARLIAAAQRMGIPLVPAA